MSEHESVRAMLALAVAGVLEEEDQSRVDRHVHDCEVCGRELETWRAYATGLRDLPQPTVSPQLMARTQALVLQGRAVVDEPRYNALTLSALAVFAWSVSLATWFLMRVFTGGSLSILGTNVLRLSTWSVGSTLLVWASAAIAAAMLARRHNELRRAI